MIELYNSDPKVAAHQSSNNGKWILTLRLLNSGNYELCKEIVSIGLTSHRTVSVIFPIKPELVGPWLASKNKNLFEFFEVSEC